MNMKRIIILLVSSSLVTIMLSGCSGESTTSSTSSTYRLDAILVKNTQTGDARVDVSLKKNGAAYTGATVKLADTTLHVAASSYYHDFTGTKIQAGHTYTLSIADSPDLSYSAAVAVPGAFTFDVTTPANRRYIGGVVNVEWNVSEDAIGYILATIPPSGVDASSGYEAYVTGQSASIPATYFQYSGSITDSICHIYMGAYWGAPISSSAIPFDMPTASVPADNVSLTGPVVTGRIASMVIPAPDSVIVPLP